MTHISPISLNSVIACVHNYVFSSVLLKFGVLFTKLFLFYSVNTIISSFCYHFLEFSVKLVRFI